jgi:hypothetical protein
MVVNVLPQSTTIHDAKELRPSADTEHRDVSQQGFPIDGHLSAIPLQIREGADILLPVQLGRHIRPTPEDQEVNPIQIMDGVDMLGLSEVGVELAN